MVALLFFQFCYSHFTAKKIIKEKTNNCIDVKIINASYVGSYYQYVVSSNIGKLFVVSNETINHCKLNDEVFLSFDESGITILKD